ncbi:hypothetical protein JCM11251_000765 [Rhodosporidiobolus azoricus]
MAVLQPCHLLAIVVDPPMCFCDHSPSMPAPSLWTSSPSPPVLPYDLLRMVAVEASSQGQTSEEKEVARAVSLVCRDLRDVGQAVLLRQVNFPRPKCQGEEDLPPPPRIVGFIRTLAWLDPDWRAIREDDIEEQEPLFKRTIQRCAHLDRLELVQYDRHRFISLFAALASSPSCFTLTHLKIHASAPFVLCGPGTHYTSGQLLEYLAIFPALTSFAGDVWRHLCYPEKPSNVQLRLSTIDIMDPQIEEPPKYPGEFDPYRPFLAALEPGDLRSVSLFHERDPWHSARKPGEDDLSWLCSSRYSLTSLSITSRWEEPPDSTFFSSLVLLLSFHTNLRHFALRGLEDPNLIPRDQFGKFYETLYALPPSVETLHLDYYLALDDYLASWFQSGQCQKLKLVRIQTWHGLYTREWKEDEQDYEEVVPKFYLREDPSDFGEWVPDDTPIVVKAGERAIADIRNSNTM